MKRWIRLSIAVVVIAGLIVALILVRRSQEADALAPDEEFQAAMADAAADRVQVLDLDRGNIQRISIRTDEGDLVLVQQETGRFRPEYPYDVAFAGARINRVVGSASSITSNRIIDESADDISVYGLDDPRAVMTVSVTDAEPIDVIVGSPVPGGGSYYVRTSDSPAVYSVSSTWISPLFYELDDLRDKTLPEINVMEIRDIRLRNTNGVQIEAVAVQDDPEIVLSSHALISPYDRRYAVSSNWIEALAEDLPEITIQRFVDDGPTNLAQYGLAPAVAEFQIRDTRNQLALRVGEQTTGGRYAQLGDGGSVFVVSGVEDIISTRAYDTVSAFVYIINIDLVDRIVVESDGQTHEARLERTPADDADEDPLETFFWDDQEMDEDLFRDLYQWMVGLLFDAELDEVPDGEEELVIRYIHNDGRPDVVVSFVRQNSNYYAAFRDGAAEFMISASKIQRLKSVIADPSQIAE